jgi:hypothetical protein
LYVFKNKGEKMVNTEIIYICKYCGKVITTKELEQLEESGDLPENEKEAICIDCLIY